MVHPESLFFKWKLWGCKWVSLCYLWRNQDSKSPATRVPAQSKCWEQSEDCTEMQPNQSAQMYLPFISNHSSGAQQRTCTTAKGCWRHFSLFLPCKSSCYQPRSQNLFWEITDISGVVARLRRSDSSMMLTRKLSEISLSDSLPLCSLLQKNKRPFRYN